jgi:hypothetical protein
VHCDEMIVVENAAVHQPRWNDDAAVAYIMIYLRRGITPPT